LLLNTWACRALISTGVFSIRGVFLIRGGMLSPVRLFAAEHVGLQGGIKKKAFFNSKNHFHQAQKLPWLLLDTWSSALGCFLPLFIILLNMWACNVMDSLIFHRGAGSKPGYFSLLHTFLLQCRLQDGL